MKTWFLKNRVALIQALFVALVAPCTLALTALGIYFANTMELPGNPGSICVSVLIQTFIGVLLLFVIQLPLLGQKAFYWIAITLFTLGFLFWFQAHVFTWDFGPLDGREIPWASYTPLGIFELFIYGVIFLLVFHFKNKILEHIVPISCILILMQTIPISFVMIQTLSQETVQADQTEDQPKHNIFIPSWKQYSVTYDDLFEFSQEENVVLVVLDAFGTKLFEDLQKEHPEEIAEIFRDFTYFDNVMCDRPATRVCVPQIIAGCSSEELPQDFSKEFVNAVIQHKLFSRDGNLLKKLSVNQYRCSVFSWSPPTMYYDARWISNIHFNDRQEKIADISELTVLTLFRSTPILLKRGIIKGERLRTFLYVTHKSHSAYQSIAPYPAIDDYDVNTWINRACQESCADQKTFKFIHLKGAHRPFTMDENCVKTTVSGNTSNGKQQALGSLRIVKNLLTLMKETDVYDQSLVIVMADHGIMSTVKDYRPMLSQDPSLSLRPSFFIKRKHKQQSQMDYCDNPIHISDTPSIILSELGILQGDDAFSSFELPESLLKERKSLWENIWDRVKERK